MKVGQQVYVVPYDTRNSPFCANVVKIGKKYIIVDNLHKSQNKFRISDFTQEGGDYSSRYKLYESKDGYQKYLSDRSECCKFLIKIQDKLNTLNIEQLKETFYFISKY